MIYYHAIKNKILKTRLLQWACNTSTDMVLMQEVNKLLAIQLDRDGNFYGFDIIVRYLAIEHYFGYNNYGFNLYEKMQNLRGVLDTHSKQRFIKLIDSFDKNGLDIHSRLSIGKNQELINGSHRLACALFFNKTLVPVDHENRKYNIRYGIDWFKEYKFTNKEISAILAKKEEIFRSQCLYFHVIIYAPLQKYFCEIESDIRNNHMVIDSYTITLDSNMDLFNKHTNSKFIRSFKLNAINRIKEYGGQVRVIEISIKRPFFVKDKHTNYDISTAARELRDRYGGKYCKKVSKSSCDQIIYIGENYTETKEIKNTFNKILINRKKFEK